MWRTATRRRHELGLVGDIIDGYNCYNRYNGTGYCNVADMCTMSVYMLSEDVW